MKRPEIFVCLPNFSGGGAEKVMTLVAHLLSSKSRNALEEKLSDHNCSPIAPAILSQKRACTYQEWNLSHVTKSAFDVTCVVLDDEGPLKSVVSERCNIENLQLPSARRAIVSLVKLFRQRKPKIVISTLAYFNFVVVLALMASRHMPKRMIVREANIPSSTIESLPMRWLGRFLYKWLYNRADIVICNSSETLDELVDLGVDRTRVALIPNPVDIEGVRKQAQEVFVLPHFLDPSLPLFVSLGRLTKQKGMDRLITWVASMGSKANLLIIGQGAERDELERLIDSNALTGRAKIIDFQDNPFPYMSNADAVLLGSRWEGLPNVALEALALGKQVVATTHCGGLLDIKHLLDDQALVIADTDEEYISILDRIVDRHQPPHNIKKTALRDNQLADSKLPSNYNLDAVMEKYEAAIFGR
jgi:glycosyltransferase involved in cell wall biosynthesis